MTPGPESLHGIVHLGLNVSSSTHNCGCLVDGGKVISSNLMTMMMIMIIITHCKTSFYRENITIAKCEFFYSSQSIVLQK